MAGRASRPARRPRRPGAFRSPRAAGGKLMTETSSRVMALVRREATAAARLALLLGLVGALGPFCLVLLKIQVYSLVMPTGSVGTAIGLATGFAVAAVLV